MAHAENGNGPVASGFSRTRRSAECDRPRRRFVHNPVAGANLHGVALHRYGSRVPIAETDFSGAQHHKTMMPLAIVAVLEVDNELHQEQAREDAGPAAVIPGLEHVHAIYQLAEAFVAEVPL